MVPLKWGKFPNNGLDLEKKFFTDADTFGIQCSYIIYCSLYIIFDIYNCLKLSFYKARKNIGENEK